MSKWFKKRFPALNAWCLQMRENARIKCAQRRVDRHLAGLRGKACVRVAFLVVLDSVFHFDRLFELMLADPQFEPFIVVIPEVDRGEAWGTRLYAQVLEAMRARYGEKVIGAYQEGRWMEVADQYDICVALNSYDALTLPIYGIKYLGKRGVPVVLSNYGYDVGSSYTHTYCSMKQLPYLWRFYCGTSSVWETLTQLQPMLVRFGRIKFSGVPKMDSMSDVKEQPRTRKRILICPHHSIEGSSLLNLSNFPKYADLFLALPKRYPQIDWVFRPHPLLASSLVLHGGWKTGDWERYVEAFTASPNATYYPSGSCFELFVNSDGMIQDCSSFLAEYHCSGHPQCYLLKSLEQAKAEYGPWGLTLLKYTYEGFSEQDIIRFIEDVVLQGHDTKQRERLQFVNDKMRYNYPHVNDWILNEMKAAIWGA